MRMRKSVQVHLVTTVWTAVAIASLASWAYANVILVPPVFATLMLVATPFWYVIGFMHARDERKEERGF